MAKKGKKSKKSEAKNFLLYLVALCYFISKDDILDF